MEPLTPAQRQRLLERLARLESERDAFLQDTFRDLDREYQAALGRVRSDLEAQLVTATTDGDRLVPDTSLAARARVITLEEADILARAIWAHWRDSLFRLERMSEAVVDPMARAAAVAVDRDLVRELIGAWPGRTAPGHGIAGQFYALDLAQRTELANVVTRGVLGRASREQLVQDLRVVTDGSEVRARRLFHDSTIQFSRRVTNAKAERRGYEWFTYVGPDDRITRPFCDSLLANGGPDPVFTREAIEAMDNGQTAPGTVMEACGGYNCRHHWRPVQPRWFEPDEWAAMVAAGT